MSGKENIYQILEEMTAEVPPLVDKQMELTNKSVFDSWNLNLDPRALDSYCKFEERKMPHLDAYLDLPLPAFSHFTDEIVELKSKLTTATGELELQKRQLIKTKTEMDTRKLQLMKMQAELYTKSHYLNVTQAELETKKHLLSTTQAELDLSKTRLNQIHSQLLDINKTKQILADERIALAVEPRDLDKKRYFFNEFNQEAFQDGFASGFKLAKTLLKIEDSRVDNEDQLDKRLRIIEKENLANRNSSVLLKPTKRCRSTRFESLAAAPAPSPSPDNNDDLFAGLSNDWDIVEGREEEDLENRRLLPPATPGEEAAAASTSSSSRVSRVNETNQHLLPSFISKESSSDEEISAPLRKPLGDVGNRQTAKLLDPPPVNPAKKPKTKKERAQMLQWRKTSNIPNSILQKLRSS